MKFKYAIEHKILSETCPPEEYEPKDLEAYRWVFDEIEISNNFTPQYFKNPKRFITMDDALKCKSMALSMWNSKEASLKRFNFLRDNLLGKRAYKVLGTKLAFGNLNEELGVSSDIEENRHFSHHPEENSDYSKVFTIIDIL